MENSKSTDIIPLKDVERMAMAISKSGLFGVKNPEQALALMLVAQAEGLHPAIAARDYDIINGKPAKKSEAMLRSFLQSGGKVKWHRTDDTCAEATFSHPAGGEMRISWDMERAKAAGLDNKDVWKKYRRQMLRARLVAEGVRAVCPMATSGMYVPEERDVAPSIDITPEVEPPTNNEETIFRNKDSEKITQAQITRLWAIAHEAGWSNEDVHANIKRTLGLDSIKDLPRGVYDKFCDYMTTNKKTVSEYDDSPFAVSHNPLNKQAPHGVV